MSEEENLKVDKTVVATKQEAKVEEKKTVAPNESTKETNSETEKKQEAKTTTDTTTETTEKTETTDVVQATPEVATSTVTESTKFSSRNSAQSREKAAQERKKLNLERWVPRTSLGKKVKDKEITSMEKILESGERILEPEIVDTLLPDMQTDFVMAGQAKGKFGGGQRRVFKQTQKKTNEGNKPSFATIVVIGNKNGLVGVGYGKSRETVPAREKAIRQAKLNLFKIPLGSGSWEGNSEDTNSIPFKVSGKMGSVQITLLPAPRGTGLRAPAECNRVLTLAGIQDIWTQTLGQTRTTTNLVRATVKALQELSKVKLGVTHQRGEEA